MSAFGGRGMSLRQLLLAMWYSGSEFQRLDFYESMLRPITLENPTVRVRGSWRSEVVR